MNGRNYKYASFLAVQLFFSNGALAQDWLSDYEYRLPITIQGAQVPSSQTDFPVLVSISGANFTTNLEGNARSDGFDVVFTDSDGFTQLDHELQLYDEGTDQLTAWVKVDLTAADQTIYVYYGNASVSTDQSTSDVWSNGFRAVWHLEDDPNGDPTDGILDDSGFGNHGTPNGTMTTADLVTAQIGNGLDMDGSNDFIDVINSSSLQITDNTITLSAWVNINPSLDNDEGIILKGANNDESYLLGTGTSGATELLRLRINDSGNNSQGGSIPITNTWHYIVGVYDGSNRIGYIDGGAAVFTSGAFSANIEHDPLDPIYLGRRADARYYEGIMDELRISDTPRSQDWVQTEFNNQGTPSSFIALGAQESCTAPVPSGGVATATDEFILSGGITTINLAGQTTGTIAWEQSTDNISFSVVVGGSGDGTPTYTTPSLTQTTYYRALISSTGGCGTDVVSTTATVFVVPPYGIGDYANRKRIIIDAGEVCGASAHTDFPILFSHTDDDFKHTGSGGDVENINGYDIVFTSNDGSTQLDHELESYNSSTGALVAWVRIPSLSNSTDTEIFVYYGDPAVNSDQSAGTTWDADYAAVWHMEDASIEDGTANDQDGVNSGTTDVEGIIGRARSFDGVDDQVTVPHVNGNSLDITGNQVTLEAWVKAPANVDDSPFIIKTPGTNQERYMVGIDGGVNEVNTRVTTDGTGGSPAGHFRDDSGPINVDDWTHVVFVYDGALGSDPRKLLYVNGTQIDSYNANGNITTTTAPLKMGKRFDARWFLGILDELRVSSSARDADWICTEYNNQSSPSTFYTVEADQPCEPAVAGGTATPFDSSIFSGESTTVSLTGNTGPTIQWQSSTDNVNFSDMVGETSSSVSTGALTQTMYYRAVVSNGSCQTVSSTATVNVSVRFLAGYSYRKKITIDGTKIAGSGALTGFPLLVSVVDPDLDAASNKVFDDTNGYDIVFTDSDGTTLLTQFNEEYDGSDGTFISWVNVDLTGGTDKCIYMNYGNCSGVADPSNSNTWDANYVGVWLLNNTLTDATSYGNDGADNNGTTNVAGKIGDARNFATGSSQWVQVPNSAELNNTGTALTMSAWVNRNSDQNIDIGIVIKSNNVDPPRYQQHLGVQTADVGNGRVRTGGTGQSSITSTTTITPGSWYYLTSVYDGSDLRFYTNGVEESSQTTTGNILDSSADPVLLGRRAIGDARYYDGIIDNARISNSARSADWVLTEYNNQNDPSTFYSVASEEAEYFWTGATDSDWSDANNWGPCTVPAIGDDIIIPNQTNDPVLDADRTIGTLQIESGASLDLGTNNLTLTGPLRNDGTFNQTTGTVTFAGSTQQRISGTSSVTLNDITLNNASNLNIATPTQVDGTLTMTAGHIVLSSDDFTIGNSGSISGFSSSQFVVTTGAGCLKQNDIGTTGKTGNVVFPIGTSTTSYTPMTINNAPGTADNFCVYVCTGFYEEGTCATGTEVTTDVVNRTWFITEDLAGGSDASLTYQWNGVNELTGFDRANTNLGHYTGGAWEVLTATAAAGGDPWTATATGVSAFSPFGAGSDGSPLPIELLYFGARAIKEMVEVEWQTASEINNDFFTVQRSLDAINFETVTTIDGAGNSSGIKEYRIIDEDPFLGLSYYRLKQTDFNGSSTYSSVESVVVFGNKDPEMKIIPNPNFGSFRVKIKGFNPDSKVYYTVRDLTGRRLLTDTATLTGTELRVTNLNLAAGTYIIEIKDNILKVSGKFNLK